MSQFPTGSFERNQVSQLHRAFCPILAESSIEKVDLDNLRARGKKLILLDVDNTLTRWKSEQIDESVVGWIDAAKAKGFHLALLSNTRHPERLDRLAGQLKIAVIPGRMKPSKSMYLRALHQFQVEADQAIMIGDQLLTDVFGANRSGIEAIWLEPISQTEFAGTKINRWIESKLMLGIFQALETSPSVDLQAPNQADVPFTHRAIFRQILRFCVVGGISFIIDAGTSILLESVIKVHGILLSHVTGTWLKATFPTIFGASTPPDHASAAIFFWIAALLAMANSFYWNRLWTFEMKGSKETAKQLRRFFIISLIGTGINSAISTHLFTIIPGRRSVATAIAKAAAAVVVAAWNFTGQRFYAFRQHHPHPPKEQS